MLIQNYESGRSPRERGIAVLVVAVCMLVLIPIVGLAIDGGLAFVVRTRLSAAMDSAALAAGRGINLDDTVANAQAQAIAQAKNFFNANFPPGYLNTDPTPANRILNATFTLNNGNNGLPNGILTISLTGSVVAPTYFTQYMGKLVGFSNLTISGSGTTTRRNLVMELVLDKSASMGNRTTAAGTIPASLKATDQSCEAMVYSTVLFTKYFSPYDNLGEMSFNYTVFDDYAAKTTWYGNGNNSIAHSISEITCGDNTNTTAALYKAYQDIKTVNEPLAQNVIVLFTDGVPNAVNATFPVRNQTDDRLGPATSPRATDVPAGHQAICDSNNTNICTNLPVCTATAGQTVTGVITQTAGFNVNSGSRGGLFKMFSTDATPTVPNGCPAANDALTSQTIAYIPDTDFFNNSMHGPNNGGSTTLWDGWLYQVNSHTAPNGTPITSGNSATKNLGDYWSNDPAVGVGRPSNFFTAGPYKNKFRPDLANTIGVASMNSATNMAATIRADTTYNITIDTVYLQGNAGDPVDRAFLQIVTNQPNIEPILYDPNAPAYANPYYQKNQQQGLWMATASTLQLQSMFQQIASSLLRISQ